MKRPLFAANWKLHIAPIDASAFMRSFLAHYGRHQDRSVLFFPSALAFHAAIDAVKERSDISFGVQNIHWEDKGAFTGENSAAIARSAGARLVLVGHSERRHVFGETEEETGLKVAAAVRAGLIPLICVGETLDQREAGDTETVVLRQLRAAVAKIDASKIDDALIAYEPVWAIGTGRNATPEDASAVHAAIADELKVLVGQRSSGIPILYGGSVNRGNAGALLAAPGVDGLLVGGASLDAEGWATICNTTLTS
ncbi:MAG: triose-phosphate isomerase [Gemmatimonadaceae bacterium]|nr:triose-phosphate isomerase [Gemmatimonadaceae bacterium]